MDTKVIEITENLKSRFVLLKNQYPDCIWLQKWLELNQKDNQPAPTFLTTSINTKDFSISPN